MQIIKCYKPGNVGHGARVLLAVLARVCRRHRNTQLAVSLWCGLPLLSCVTKRNYPPDSWHLWNYRDGSSIPGAADILFGTDKHKGPTGTTKSPGAPFCSFTPKGRSRASAEAHVPKHGMLTHQSAANSTSSVSSRSCMPSFTYFIPSTTSLVTVASDTRVSFRPTRTTNLSTLCTNFLFPPGQ